jgi:hypothetical protein
LKQCGLSTHTTGCAATALIADTVTTASRIFEFVYHFKRFENTMLWFVGARWKKPTTFWVQNFTWKPLHPCGSNAEAFTWKRMHNGSFFGPYCDHIQEAIDSGDPSPKHLDSLSGKQVFTLKQKWHVPLDLCLEILTAMICSRCENNQQPASWFLSLYAGAGNAQVQCCTI